MGDLIVSVVIPTYNRPDYLDRCVRSLFEQKYLPGEIIIVSRVSDEPTNSQIDSLKNEFSNRIPIHNPQITLHGFLPPIQQGIKQAVGDIVAFLDDDAEALPFWLKNITDYYSDDSVGGVGGRVINYFDFKLITYPIATRVGQLSWYGRNVGNMYKESIFTSPIEVDFFMGGNMSFRRQLLLHIEPDPVLNNNVAFHWEIDFAQQVKKKGYKLLYNPEAKINHYSAPRDTEGLRTYNFEGIFYSNFNYMYIMLKHLTLSGKIAYCLYSLCIGHEKSPGIASLIRKLFRDRCLDWNSWLYPSFSGRFSGFKTYIKHKVTS